MHPSILQKPAFHSRWSSILRSSGFCLRTALWSRIRLQFRSIWGLFGLLLGVFWRLWPSLAALLRASFRFVACFGRIFATPWAPGSAREALRRPPEPRQALPRGQFGAHFSWVHLGPILSGPRCYPCLGGLLVFMLSLAFRVLLRCACQAVHSC